VNLLGGVGRRLLGLVPCLVLAFALSACEFVGGDDSGVGGFDRTPIAQVRMLASVDDDGTLTIVEQAPVSGRIADPSLLPVGPVQQLRDIFDYGLVSDRSYQLLLTPTVEAQQDADLGDGQYSILYLHDPETDLPANGFPERGIDPERLLNCVRDTFDTATRFNALVAGVDDGADAIWDCRVFYVCQAVISSTGGCSRRRQTRRAM